MQSLSDRMTTLGCEVGLESARRAQRGTPKGGRARARARERGTHKRSVRARRDERGIVGHVERRLERRPRAGGHERLDDARRERRGRGRREDDRVGPAQVPREEVVDPALEGKVALQGGGRASAGARAWEEGDEQEGRTKKRSAAVLHLVRKKLRGLSAEKRRNDIGSTRTVPARMSGCSSGGSQRRCEGEPETRRGRGRTASRSSHAAAPVPKLCATTTAFVLLQCSSSWSSS